MTVDNSSQIPYEACLMTIFPEELQQQMRNITNHVVIPLNILLAVMSFVCNALVVYAVARTKRLQRPPLLMLCSLVITDLLYAPHALISFMMILAHEHMCPERPDDAVVMLGPLCVLATLGNLAIISRDRYLAVKRPWWYRTRMTKSRAIKVISVPWLCSLVITFLLYLSLKFQFGFSSIGRVASLSFYLVCFFVITISYLGLFCGKRSSEDALYIRAILEREKRMANTVGLILLVLVITFLPGVLTPLVLHAISVSNVQLYKPLYSFAFLLNGLFNPMLNFGRSKEMRRALRKLLICSRSVQPSPCASFIQRRQQQQQQELQLQQQQQQSAYNVIDNINAINGNNNHTVGDRSSTTKAARVTAAVTKFNIVQQKQHN